MPTKKDKNEFLEILGNRYAKEFFADADRKLGQELDSTGILVLHGFVSSVALRDLQREAASIKSNAYGSTSSYNIYVLPTDERIATTAPRNRKFETTKGCVADDQISEGSILRSLYVAPLFRDFICRLQGLQEIFPYADTLSSININYYDPTDSLEWHFDNADFAITLLIKKCDRGGVYEYMPNIRYTETGEENYTEIADILDGKITPRRAEMEEGDLMIFRGNRSLHRVTNIEIGERILVTLNYNVRPGIPLSEKSRMTFFGRVS